MRVRTAMICKCQRCVYVTLKLNELHERGVKNVCLFGALNFILLYDEEDCVVWFVNVFSVKGVYCAWVSEVEVELG